MRSGCAVCLRDGRDGGPGNGQCTPQKTITLCSELHSNTVTNSRPLNLGCGNYVCGDLKPKKNTGKIKDSFRTFELQGANTGIAIFRKGIHPPLGFRNGRRFGMDCATHLLWPPHKWILGPKVKRKIVPRKKSIEIFFLCEVSPLMGPP